MLVELRELSSVVEIKPESEHLEFDCFIRVRAPAPLPTVFKATGAFSTKKLLLDY